MPQTRSPCSYSNSLVSVLQPAPPLVPWIPSLWLHQNRQCRNYPSSSASTFPHYWIVLISIKQALTSPILKNNPSLGLISFTVYCYVPFISKLKELPIHIVFTSFVPTLSWIRPHHAFVPTSPWKQLLSKSSMEWPPCFQIILFCSIVEPDLPLVTPPSVGSSSSPGALNISHSAPGSVLEVLFHLHSLTRSSVMASDNIQMLMNYKLHL